MYEHKLPITLRETTYMVLVFVIVSTPSPDLWPRLAMTIYKWYNLKLSFDQWLCTNACCT